MSILSTLPDTSLPVGDLIGRACRWSRANIRALFKILVYPVLLYELGWEALPFVLGHKQIPGQVFFACLATALIILLNYECGARQMAVWRLKASGESDFSSSLRQSRRPALLLVFLPSVIADLVLACFILLANEEDFVSWIMNLLNQFQLEQYAVALLIPALFIFFLLPYSIVTLWCSLLACTMESERLSVFAAFKRLWGLMRRAPFFFLGAVVLLGVVSNAVQMPTFLLSGLEALIGMAPDGAIKLTLEILSLSTRVAVIGLLQIFLVGLDIAGATCIYNEMRMRIEGADIIQSLEKAASGRA